MNKKSGLSGIITKSIALSILVPVFMLTTSFFVTSGLDSKAQPTEASNTAFSGESHGSEEAAPSFVMPEQQLPESSENNRTVFSKSDWKLILVNKQHPIPEDYEFPIGDINSYMQCDERIRKSLMSMLSAASAEKVYIFVASPYRSDDQQGEIFTKSVDALMDDGVSFADAYKETSQEITIPGTSEHQIGLAVDIIIDYYQKLDEGFSKTKAYKWLIENCADYGFILRYPKDKENITGIGFEPWHYRYVGEEAAHIIMEEGLTLEEFTDEYIYR